MINFIQEFLDFRGLQMVEEFKMLKVREYKIDDKHIYVYLGNKDSWTISISKPDFDKWVYLKRRKIIDRIIND